MKRFLGALCFAPWLLLGIAYPMDPPSTLEGGLWLLAIHLAFIGVLILMVRSARRSQDKTFLGFSPSFWVVASVASYGLGALTPFLAISS